MSNNFEMIRNAQGVKLDVNEGPRGGKTQVRLVVQGEHGVYANVLPATDHIVKALSVYELKDVEARLRGGHFFCVGDKIHDYREASYNGFVHDEASVKQLAESLGTSPLQVRQNRRVQHQARFGAPIGKEWSDINFAVPTPGVGLGGEFNLKLHFKWSPFAQTVNSIITMIRQICSNGMVAMGEVFNTRIPLVNRWVEHLDIAARHLSTRVETAAVESMCQMCEQRATIADVHRIVGFAQSRLEEMMRDGARPLSERRYTLDEREEIVAHLKAIIECAAPINHLQGVYNHGVLMNEGQFAHEAEHLPSHITEFTAFNMVTEIQSHTPAAEFSSDKTLNAFANDLLFVRSHNRVLARGNTDVEVADFENPHAAFVGDLSSK